MNLGHGSKTKGVGESSGKSGSKRKGRGKLSSMNLGRGSKRKGMGESSGESCIA